MSGSIRVASGLPFQGLIGPQGPPGTAITDIGTLPGPVGGLRRTDMIAGLRPATAASAGVNGSTGNADTPWADALDDVSAAIVVMGGGELVTNRNLPAGYPGLDDAGQVAAAALVAGITAFLQALPTTQPPGPGQLWWNGSVLCRT